MEQSRSVEQLSEMTPDFLPQFDFIDLADRLGFALQTAEDESRLEQAVYGLDGRDEKSLQSLLAERLAPYYEVSREVHYPSTFGKKLSHRQRCDLVLTDKGRPLRLDVAPPTLFDPVSQVGPEKAVWLEVKVAYQFRQISVRHGGYGRQWRGAVVDDLRKMEAEPMIRQAGLLLIVFNESREILQKDLELFENVLAEKEILAGFRQVRTIGILDRIGHTLCGMALWPTISATPSSCGKPAISFSSSRAMMRSAPRPSASAF